jgi:GH43 family beta-xylosidase
MPAHHLLMLAPGLQADWFFEAAGAYWRTFRPVLTTEIDLLQYIPAGQRVAVTVLARSDTIAYMDEQIRDVWPGIMYDPVVSDSLEEMTQLLNWRVDANLPYGLVFDE